MRKILASLLFVMLFSPVFAQSYTLQYNLEEGKTYRQNMVSEMNMQSKFGGQNMDIKMTMTCLISYKVLQKTATDFQMESSFNAMKINMVMSNGTNVTFDSENKGDQSPMSRMLAGLAGKTFTCRITPQGQMTEVKGLEELYQSVFSGLSSLNEEQKEQVSQQIRQAFGEKSLRNNFQYSSVFPDHAVKPGDKWKMDNSMDVMMPVKLTSEYELKAVEADAYHVLGTATLDPASSGSDNGFSPIQLTGKIESDLKLDLKSCWPKSSLISFKATGKMGEGGEDALTIDMKISITE